MTDENGGTVQLAQVSGFVLDGTPCAYAVDTAGRPWFYNGRAWFKVRRPEYDAPVRRTVREREEAAHAAERSAKVEMALAGAAAAAKR